MTLLDEVVDLNITTEVVSTSRAGFGIPLCMAVHSLPAVLQVFGSLSELTDAGITLTEPAYLMANAAFSQDPKPTKIVLGKRSLPYTQIVELTPIKTTTGYVYAFTVIDHLGIHTDIEYTVPGSSSVASICTALAALIDPVAAVTAAGSPSMTPTKIVVTAAAGQLFNITGLPPIAVMTVADVTTDPGIATDLTAIEALDSTTWYAVSLDHSGKAEIAAAATWIQSRRKTMVVNSSDSACADPSSTTDCMSVNQLAGNNRSEILFCQQALQSYGATGWLGVMLPKPPGSATWAYKTIAGLLPDTLTTGQKSAITAKNGNTYMRIGGFNVTQWGTEGKGGFIDTKIGEDWLYAQIQESLIAALVNADKIPYTDSGAQTMFSLISAQLKKGVKAGYLAASPAPVVTVPKVSDQDVADRGTRYFPGITWTATLAGAIHKVKINGRLAV